MHIYITTLAVPFGIVFVGVIVCGGRILLRKLLYSKGDVDDFVNHNHGDRYETYPDSIKTINEKY